MNKTVKKSEITKERIDKVARNLFRKRGFRLVTMRDIATGAGVPVSVLYYYYRSKDDLYTEITYQEVLQMFQRLRQRADLSLERPLEDVFTDLLAVRAPQNLTPDELALYRTSILEWLGTRGDTQLTRRLRALIEAGKQAWISELEKHAGSQVPVQGCVVSLVYEYLEHETINMLFGIRTFDAWRVRQEVRHILYGPV